jgi:hypothetical protein
MLSQKITWDASILEQIGKLIFKWKTLKEYSYM